MSNQSKKSKPKNNYKIVNEKVYMTVDLKKQSLKGMAHITVQPLKLFDRISFNSRSCHISYVEVNDVEADFNILELMINIIPPQQINLREQRTLGSYWKISQIAAARGELNISIPMKVLQEIKMNPNTQMNIKIYYESIDPKGGMFFVPSKEDSKEISYMYTDSQYGGIRNIFPCADNFINKTFYELEITTNSENVVVASGNLIGKFQNNERQVTYVYRSEYPISPNLIFFAIGKFEIYPDPTFPESVTHFCLPGDLSKLKCSVKYLHEMHAFFQTFLGIDFPFKSYKTIFLGQIVQHQRYESVYEGVSVYSRDLLFDKTNIDQVYKLRKLMALSLAQQYYGCFVTGSDYQHSWITKGLATKLSFQYIKKMLGKNEYMYECYKLIQRLEDLSFDTHQKPLLNYEVLHPAELSEEYYNLKSFFVIRTMEELVSSQAFICVHKALLRPSSSKSLSYLRDRNWSTRKFLNLVKNLTGYDMNGVYERFIIGTSIINLKCGFTFNEKDQNLEFVLHQDLTKSRFSGSVQVCIVERDGSNTHTFPFSQIFAHSFSEMHVFSRVKKQRKKKNTETIPEEANSQTTQTTEIVCEDHPLAPLRYVKIDPDKLWFKKLSYRQPEWMWKKQLESDPSIFAQIDAVYGLTSFKNLSCIDILERALVDERLYHRVRQHAARALSMLSVKETGWKGMHVLLDFYREVFFLKDKSMPIYNDFSDFSNYFVRCKAIRYISTIKNDKGFTPNEILDFMLELLKFNDNTHNPFTDNYYLASILVSYANVDLDPSNSSHTDAILEQFNRYLKLERIMPSYRNIISVACIRSICSLGIKGHLNVGHQYFATYLHSRNYINVRLEALKSVIHINLSPKYKGQQEPHKIIEDILSMIENQNEDISFKVKAVTILENYLSDKANFTSSIFEKDEPINRELGNKVWSFMSTSLFTGYNPRLRYLCFNIYKHLWGMTLPRPFFNTPANDKSILLANEPSPEELQRRVQEYSLILNQKDSSEKKGAWSTLPTARTLRIRISKNVDDENSLLLVPHADLIVHKTVNEKGEIVDHPTLNKNKRPSVFDIPEKPSKKKGPAKKKTVKKSKGKDKDSSPHPPKKTPIKKAKVEKKEESFDEDDEEDEYNNDDMDDEDEVISPPLSPPPVTRPSRSIKKEPSPTSAPTPVTAPSPVEKIPKIKIKFKIPTNPNQN